MQVTLQPSLVISSLHAPIIRLQVQTTIPFIMQQTLHMPLAIIVQRFCIIVHAAGSSQMQVIFIPPVHFSTFMVHRGTMTMFGAIGMLGEDVGMPMFIPVIVARSIIIALVMIQAPEGVVKSVTDRFPHTCRPVFTLDAPEISTETSNSITEQLLFKKPRLGFIQNHDQVDDFSDVEI